MVCQLVDSFFENKEVYGFTLLIMTNLFMYTIETFSYIVTEGTGLVNFLFLPDSILNIAPCFLLV